MWIKYLVFKARRVRIKLLMINVDREKEREEREGKRKMRKSGKVTNLQNSQDHLTRVHEIGVGVGGSRMGQTTTTTAEDFSGGTILNLEI